MHSLGKGDSHTQSVIKICILLTKKDSRRIKVVFQKSSRRKCEELDSLAVCAPCKPRTLSVCVYGLFVLVPLL